MTKKCSWLTCAVVAALAGAAPASAQGLDTLGTRAAGLGAFVAVADDASAVAWNPAGLIAGPIFNVSLDLGRSAAETDWPPSGRSAARRMRTVMFSASTLPLGLTYYRLASPSVAPSPAVLENVDRQNDRVVIRTLVTNHLGATLLQSVGDHLTLGATLKLIRGSVGLATSTATSWADGFEQADRLDRRGTTRGDVDLGAMFTTGRVRAGVVVRNTTAPTFGDEESTGTARLDRHVRVGAAWGDTWPGLTRTVVSLDADLTRVGHAREERRDVAAGVERWFREQQIGVRAGLRASTVGGARPVFTAGGSYAIRAGLYVDVFAGRGSADERSWGLAARLTY